jgi:hypothetical protein
MKGGGVMPQMLTMTHHPEIVDVADVIDNEYSRKS